MHATTWAQTTAASVIVMEHAKHTHALTACPCPGSAAWCQILPVNKPLALGQRQKPSNRLVAILSLCSRGWRRFLLNNERLALGQRQSGRVIGDVALPAWASTPRELLLQHRAALESPYVSANLHHWLDLIFGWAHLLQAADHQGGLSGLLCPRPVCSGPVEPCCAGLLEGKPVSAGSFEAAALDAALAAPLAPDVHLSPCAETSAA